MKVCGADKRVHEAAEAERTPAIADGGSEGTCLAHDGTDDFEYPRCVMCESLQYSERGPMAGERLHGARRETPYIIFNTAC